jgi:hypothetical protein
MITQQRDKVYSRSGSATTQTLWYVERGFEDQQFPKETGIIAIVIIIIKFISIVYYLHVGSKATGPITDTHNVGTGNYIKNKHNTKTKETTIIQFQFNSIQFFIIYVLSQQPQGQLQTQHSVGKSSYIRDKQNIKSKTN